LFLAIKALLGKKKGKEKNQCPREGMFSVSFSKARGRDEG
jgi:hypothetical protein